MNDFINKTIGDNLDYIAEKFPENDALVYVHKNLRYNYREFNNVINQAAKGFIKMGIKKGDHVAIWATNYPEWVITFFATAKIGAVLVTVNTNYKRYELEYLLKQSDSNTLILMDGLRDVNYTEIICELCPELKTSKPGELNTEKFPFLKNVVYLGENQPEGMFTWQNIMDMGMEISDEQLKSVQESLNAHDVINMQYTSGTTGFPKGVMLTHYNIQNNGYSIGECMNLTEKDRYCIPVPFFHCFGIVLSIMACVTHGSTMVPVEYYSPKLVLESIHKERCTAVNGVPTMFIFMLEHPEFDNFDLASLRTGIMAGSTCPVEVMRRVIDKMNMTEITIVYGQTESSPGITQTRTTDDVEVRVSTVGRCLPGIEVKIIDPETRLELSNNQIGELCSRGYNTMKGYYKMEEATKSVIDEDGWLHTGDLAFRDDNGNYVISGRIKDMIIRGGENIYPREIEELLYTHPAISDVQVVAVPSRKMGEEVAAFIILKENEAITEDEVKDYVLKNMSRHKVPKFVLFIDELPMTASGKIQKYKLREQAIEKLKDNDDIIAE